jgi:hypothetical protein
MQLLSVFTCSHLGLVRMVSEQFGDNNINDTCKTAPTSIFTQNTHCAWAGGTFFPVVLLCQFLVLAGNRFWSYILMYLEYNTVVVLF